jgi:hypothetical protein
LTLGSGTGVISGTPSSAGSSGFTVRASSGDGQTATRALSITVEAASGPAGLTNECDSPGAGWIWCDDFDRDRLGAYFEYNSNGGGFIRQSGVGVEGSSAMSATFGPGMVTAGDLKVAFGRTPDGYMAPVDAGTSNYREIYWRQYVKMAPGWTGGGGWKLSRATVFSAADWSQAAIGHVWSTPTDHSVLTIDPASGTDTSGNVVTNGYNDFPNLRWFGEEQGTTPLFTDANAGTWYCVEVRMRLNDAGASNGEMQMWIDGNLEASATGMNWVGSYSAYGINTVMFENYWNDGAPQTQTRYFDNIVISTQPIGCGGSPPPPPPPSDPVLSVTRAGGNNQSGEVGTALPDPLRVRVVTDGGTGVAGHPVTWEVVSGGGSVSPTNTVTDASGYAEATWTLGPTAGSGRARATATDVGSRDFDATATDSGSPPPPPGGSNEPAGFTKLTERSFDAISEDGWMIEDAGGATIVDDASAPRSASKVMRVEYPSGWSAGYSTIDMEKSTGRHTKNFLSFYIKFSSNFQGENSSTNKLFFNWIHNNPAVFLSAEGRGSGSLRPTVRLQNMPGGESREYLYPNVVPSVELNRGQWHHWEVLFEANTPGSKNGRVTWWIDGVKVGEYTDIMYSGSGQGNLWELLELSPIWGGVAGRVESTMDFTLDHVYLSGSN